MPKTEYTGRQLYERKVETGETYREIAEDLGQPEQVIYNRTRAYWRRYELPAPSKIEGGINEQPRTPSADLWKRALDRQKRQDQHIEWKQKRRIIFDSGPVVLVFMGDLHLGSEGTDYRAIDHDIETINQLSERVTTNIVLLGDLMDNFIVGRLKDLRMTQSPFLVIEEWGLVDYALERLTPYLVGSVAGNHDNWSWSVSGVDLLAERHRALTPGILYDPLELAFRWTIGDQDIRVMCRHDWRGHSMYNPTHGLEHGHHTLGRDFDVGVGAHTHRGGLAREIANGHDTPSHALICGTYKKADAHAVAKGYPPPLATAAVAAVADETGVLFSTSNLDGLLRVLGV